MLARKAGFVPYTENHTVVRRGHGWAKSSVKYRRWIVGIVIAVIMILANLGMGAIVNDVSYELTTHKLHARKLSRENEILRVEVAKLETPERIYTSAEKLGMKAPAIVLYGTAHDTDEVVSTSR